MFLLTFFCKIITWLLVIKNNVMQIRSRYYYYYYYYYYFVCKPLLKLATPAKP